MDYAITGVPLFFLPSIPFPAAPPPISISPPPPAADLSSCPTCQFFGFSTSHTILNLPLSILDLAFMLLIPCTFLPILPLPLLTDNPSCDLHFGDCVPVLAVCSVCFCFCFVF